MATVGIVFGSDDGYAEDAAEYIGKSFDSEIIDAQDLNEDFLAKYKKLIFVASTHRYGELQKDFKAKLELLAETDFVGKILALVGLGGQEKHPETFCDCLVEFLPVIRGAKLIGAYEDPGYNYQFSLSFINGKFVGLVLDLKADQYWKEKVDRWVVDVKKGFAD